GVYYHDTTKSPSTNALNEALRCLEAKAIYEGSEMPVSVRVVGHAGNIYLDLCNPQWEVVEITPAGWRILPRDPSPVKSRRPRGMLALPRPVPGGRLEVLRSFLGIREERHWRLVVGWMVMAFRPRGPYPLLGLHGEQGSGKSTRARIIRLVIDPHIVPL